MINDIYYQKPKSNIFGAFGREHSEDIRIFTFHVLSYSFLDIYTQTWIGKTAGEESTAENIAQPFNH